METMTDDDRKAAYSSSPPTHWGPSPHFYPHSHHGTPAQEYSAFNFGAPLHIPMEPARFQHRPMAQQLQPLIMPQWPSMLNSQAHSTYQPPVSLPPVQPIQPSPMSSMTTPVSAGSSRSASTPRKTLSDLDRKRMCLYAEEHPSSKQTEIGAIFGVERSTVSKVLRQKDKYLTQDDGSRSPAKRVKGRSPDIERALAVWAKNQEKKGQPLTDDLIRDKARAFVATTSNPDSHAALSSVWIEKFKLKNNLMGARSRKSSLAPDESDNMFTTISSSQTPGGISPVSPVLGPSSPGELHNAQSHESLKNESPDSYFDFGSRHGPFHSQSTNSLNSAFTDTAPSSFSPGPLSPTSPFFTPDSGTAPSPFVPSLNTRQTLPITTTFSAIPSMSTTLSANQPRPRSLTFPQPDQYMSTSAEAMTPKHIGIGVLDSTMTETPESLVIGLDGPMPPHDRPPTVTPSETMRPPPLPQHIHPTQVHSTSRELDVHHGTSQMVTSPEEARRALEVVLDFFHQQPSGFFDMQESMAIGKMMEKLKLHSRATT